jgi:LysM repeat protein
MVENEGVTDLKTGQIILVPVISLPQEAKKIAEEMTSPSHAPSTVITSSSPVYHSVQSKETLFSISKKYNVTIDDIKEWNNLTTSQVNKGQKIIVGYKEKKDTGKPSSNTEPTGANSKNHDNVFASSYKESPALMKNNEVITADAGNTVPAPSAPRKPLKEIKQTGVAAWIADNELDKNKYYALHRTAAIGTIIKVTNRMNNKYVFVKVVGVLPETGDNDNLVIKLSQAAAGKLGVIDSRFQAGLSYGVMEE